MSSSVPRLEESLCCWNSNRVVSIRSFVQCGRLMEQMMRYSAGVVVELSMRSRGELSPPLVAVPMILVAEEASCVCIGEQAVRDYSLVANRGRKFSSVSQGNGLAF